MSLTNAERQKQWRARRNAMARDAIDMKQERNSCILCLLDRETLDDDGTPVVGYSHGFICEKCIIETAADIKLRGGLRETRRWKREAARSRKAKSRA